METLPRTLIADDDATFGNITAAFLSSHGFECHCAADASSALAKFNAGPYDLLITYISENAVDLIAIGDEHERRC